MVMEEMPTPRDTHLLLRGEYDKKGPKVLPGLPAALPALPKGTPNNRLGFASWLVARENPLTARVAVNRSWQMLFGVGIVKTVEDFGAQGDWPSHPELLDWLAVEYSSPCSGRGTPGVREVRATTRACGVDPSPRGEGTAWDIKRLLKLIVTSATYRQSSRASRRALASNRILTIACLAAVHVSACRPT